MTDLGTLGGPNSSAVAINALGQVTGTAGLPVGDPGCVFGTFNGGCTHAFRWTPSGGMRDLGRLVFPDSAGAAINDLGQVTGSADLDGFVWTRSGGMQEIGSSGSASVGGLGINDLGRVVGTGGQNMFPVAFRWTRSGGTQILVLYTSGSPVSSGAAINNLGQVVGSSLTCFLCATRQLDAFRWTPSGGIQDLGPGRATAINDLGQIAGTNGAGHAFRWTPSGGMQDLGTLGGATSSAVAINLLGEVTGTSDTAGGAHHAFVWTRWRGMVDLGTLGGTNSSASGINALGQVVGTSDTAGGTTRAFRWTPTPRHAGPGHPRRSEQLGCRDQRAWADRGHRGHRGRFAARLSVVSVNAGTRSVS